MSEWSLPALFDGLHKGIEQRLKISRAVHNHPVMKGDASEAIWLEFLGSYLPARYQATRAVVVDSKGQFSQQIDIVVHDRHFTPFMFYQEGQAFVPAESVYAVFEAKQSLNAERIDYAGEKAASVRRLYRTSLPVPNIYGKSPAKPLHPILAGVLTLDSDWNPGLGQALADKLALQDPSHRLNMGCAASKGLFAFHDEIFKVSTGSSPATEFLFELIAQLQELGSAPMIDIRAYAAWLHR
jgi:hypothetical protein